MTTCVVAFVGRVMGVVYDVTHQCTGEI